MKAAILKEFDSSVEEVHGDAPFGNLETGELEWGRMGRTNYLAAAGVAVCAAVGAAGAAAVRSCAS